MSLLLDLSEADIAQLSDEDVLLLLESARAIEDAEKFGKFKALFPDEGPFRRELYPKHMDFFAAGLKYRERCAMAANRVGKTYGMGGYETTCHLTGDYPDWWPGHRFKHPIRAWAAGKTNETTRDIVQTVLLGEITFDRANKRVDGSGLIPRERILQGKDGGITWKAGVADLVDTVSVRHRSGGVSKLGLKSYQQGRGAFEGTAQHWIWLDEEPPEDVYGECLIRTATTKGKTAITFTPLQGMSKVVIGFLPKEMQPETDDYFSSMDGNYA